MVISLYVVNRDRGVLSGDGAAAPASPLAQTLNGVQLTIGGISVPVSFAGLTPGLYQINAILSAGVPSGNAVSVTITVAGQTSPEITRAIK